MLFIEKSTCNVVIQIKGKKVDVLELRKGLSKDELEKIALANDKMQKKIDGAEIRKSYCGSR